MTPDKLPPLNQTLVMLDFDGTLVDLAATPDGIVIPADLCTMLADINKRSAGLTLITGRAIANLTNLVPDYHGDIFGSHGSESRIDGVYSQTVDISDDLLQKITAGADAIASDNLLSEHKPAGVVLHYRQAPEREDDVTRAMAALIKDTDAFEIHHSKMAVEIRPKGTSKADAALTVMAKAPSSVYVFFAGDDTTDEDAMKVINTKNGTTVKIGSGETCAQNHVANPDEFRQLLRDWIKAR